jgi:hypothetical protein
MSFTKHGSAEGQGVTGTEGPVTKTAATDEPWTPADDEELAEESSRGETADQE